MNRLLFCAFCCAILCFGRVYAQDVPTVFHYHDKQSEKDTRFDYDKALLQLVLEKTKETHGPYLLKSVGEQVNYKRIFIFIEKNNFENLFFKHAISNEVLEKLGCVPFPVDLGIVGYRVGFVSKKIQQDVAQVETLDDLKQYSIVQGLGWLDTQILKSHNFNVIDGPSYKSLFGIVAKNRGDIFLRGANEVYSEWTSYNKVYPLLDYDRSFVLYYPLPRFFCTNKKNKDAIARVAEGLKIAYADGSLKALWDAHYSESIQFANLGERRLFKIKNPFISEEIEELIAPYLYVPK